MLSDMDSSLARSHIRNKCSTLDTLSIIKADRIKLRWCTCRTIKEKQSCAIGGLTRVQGHRGNWNGQLDGKSDV